jgi:uncharacterized cupredoxin-like copper-binding protein
LGTRIKALTAVAGLALALTAVAGCGGGSSNSSSTTATTNTSTSTTPATTTPASKGAATTLKLDADPSGQLKFTKSTLNAKSGQVTIKMTNPAPLPHSIGVKGNGVQQTGATVGKGGVSTVTVNLKPGKYEFYCPVDGHEAAGMKGTLTIK